MFVRSRRRRRRSGPRFPWGRTAVIVLAIWGSLWAAGLVGSEIGARVYRLEFAPSPPFTEEQLSSMRQVSPSAAEVAERDMRLWQESVTVGESVAGVHGALIGTVLLLSVWVVGGLVWLWNREGQRRAEAEMEAYEAG